MDRARCLTFQSMKNEQHGDTKWLGSVIDNHAPALLRYATSIVRDADAARDIVQETFVRFCQQPQAFIEDRVEAWLFRVCRNQAIDYRRKEGRMMPLDDETTAANPATGPHPDIEAEDQDSHARILRLMDSLPENQRDVVRLKFQNDLGYKEIAEVTDLSVSNVGFLLHTALKTLRGQLLAAGD